LIRSISTPKRNHHTAKQLSPRKAWALAKGTPLSELNHAPFIEAN